MDIVRGEDKVEPGELLEEGWFFGSFFQSRKLKMSRSFSDPCTISSNYEQEILPGKSYEETYASIKKLSGNDEVRPSSMMRAPSLPSSMERNDQSPQTEERCNLQNRRCKCNRKKSSNSLNRAPSLPTSLGSEEFQDEEIEFSMGELIRQASMNDPDVLSLPPRKHMAKSLPTSSSSISRLRSRKKPDLESIKLEGLKPQQSTNKLKTQKSLNDLEYEELQGFKDLSFDSEKTDLSPNVRNKIPGLQETKRTEKDEEKSVRKPYVSEERKAQSAPPVPKWGGKRSTEDNMKAQIKFWARAVASNVRQEC